MTVQIGFRKVLIVEANDKKAEHYGGELTKLQCVWKRVSDDIAALDILRDDRTYFAVIINGEPKNPDDAVNILVTR